MRHLISIACLVFAVANPAAATPRNSTKINHFSIAGATPSEILNSLHRRGPSVQGVNAYATTRAEFVSRASKSQSGNSCRVKSFAFELKFTMNLPKLSNEASLTPGTASAWSKFNGFIKKHEETHKKIWLACGRSYEAAFRNLAGEDCRTANAKAAKLLQQMRNSCDAKHAAFDTAEHRALTSHPFVRMVLAGR